MSLINMFISAGLLYVHLRPEAVPGLGWNPPFRAYTAAVWFFFASNVFLVVVPWVPPAPGYHVFERIPYYVSEDHDSTIGVLENSNPQLTTSPPIVALHRGIGSWVYGRRVLVCESGLSTPQGRVHTQEGGGGRGWNQAHCFQEGPIVV